MPDFEQHITDRVKRRDISNKPKHLDKEKGSERGNIPTDSEIILRHFKK